MRPAVVFLEGDGVSGEVLYLPVAEAGKLLISFSHRYFREPALGVAHEFYGLAADLLYQDRQAGILADLVFIGRDGAIHGIGAKPPHRGDDDVVVMRVEGVASVDHAAGNGVDHADAGYAHRDVFIRYALHDTVGHRARGEEAGNNESVVLQDQFARYVEHGQVLAREGKVAVLSESAAAHRDTGRRRRTVPLNRRAHFVIGGQDRSSQRLGNR